MLSEWDLNEMMKKAGIPATARHVLRTIRMRLAMGKAFPSYQTIADDVGISRRSAIKTVGDCVENGWLAIRKRSKAPGHNDTNVYELTPRPDIWCATSDRQPAEDCAAQVATVKENHRGGDRRSLGVVNVVHQGSDRRSLKQGSNEETNEEESKEHRSAADAADPPLASDEAPIVPVFYDGFPAYLLDFCQENRIEDAERVWQTFQCHAARERYRFEGAAWGKPAAAKLFGRFVSAGLAQMNGCAKEAA